MKKTAQLLLMTVACLSVSTSSDAQSSTHLRAPQSPLHSKSKHSAHNSAIPNKKSAAKTTATDTRLVSGVYLDCDGASFNLVDSFALTYTGSNGWKHYDQGEEFEWIFDEADGYEYDQISSTYGSHSYSKSTQTFDANNNPTTMLSQDWDALTTTWVNSYQQINTYDAANNRLSETTQYWSAPSWENIYKTVKTYTVSNKVATEEQPSWNSLTSTWDNSYKYIYTYDVSDKLTTKLGQTWNSVTSIWEDSYRETYTYDASGNVLLVTIATWDGATWQDSQKTTATYDASNNKLTSTVEIWDMGTSSWEPYNKELYSSYVGTHPQTIIYQTWDGGLMAFENTSKENYTYNSYNKQESYSDQTWDVATGAWVLTTDNYAERYHYEVIPTLAVNDTKLFSGKAIAFPAPASDKVSLDVNWNTPQPFSVSIIDMQGRVHTSWTQPAQAHYTETVALSNLPSGNYVIAINGTTEKTSLKLNVIK